MSQTIAGIYEIEQQIGAGGGGIVYLGRHTRLNKKVVLKADKRTLHTETEVLRREVDLLKKLSHEYIPHVYDFVQENGVVYTIMDYIDGESLDKVLNRKELPSQPQLIQWACQLLEALSYLHAQPPYGILHGDIKPANIMLRANGNICLIDFNIALALGEEGAVNVGFSRGYASPEHYGLSYIVEKMQSEGISVTEKNETDITEVNRDFDEKTEAAVSSGINIAKENRVKLDIRSDIYSLGATLYHLISGMRPAKDARDVVPLGKEVCSPAVSAILQKAMNYRIEERYQTADEMLEAFLSLKQSDERVIKFKKRTRANAAAIAGLFLIGGASIFLGQNLLRQEQKALTLAEYSSNELRQGNVDKAVELALQAMPDTKGPFRIETSAEAQKALTDALGVYDLADGFKTIAMLKLPSEPFDLVISPDGDRLGVVYAYSVAVWSLDSQQKLIELPAQQSALSELVFVDNSRIIYAGDQGITAYDIDKQKVLWKGDVATTITVSADKKIIASVNRDDDHAVIYQVSDGEKIADCSFEGRHMNVAVNDIFADPDNDIFALNEDGSLLAVSSSDGALIIYDLISPDKSIVIFEKSDFRHFEGGFCNIYFAFSARKNNGSQFGIIDVKEAGYIAGYSTKDKIKVCSGKDGIYVSSGNLLEKVDPVGLTETELAYTNGINITGFSVGRKYCVVAGDNHSFAFYDSGANGSDYIDTGENTDFLGIGDKYAVVANRNTPEVRVMRLENHADSQLLSYDAGYEHDEARISKDGQTVMLFDYKKFLILDMNGQVIAQTELPNPESIYDQQFRREENSYLEVIWYDGMIRRYSASDGRMIMEEKKAEVSKELYEEFYTERYRIESSLHSAPKVYLLNSDKMVASLEEDAYLTYVTQVEEYIVTEYINTEGKRYGILLNGNLDKLAYLPDLCDVYENNFIFDYGSGDLRQCRIYSLQELLALGEAYMNQ
ncbi:MAG: protein kinase [Alistipes sp.]|nr:protein kinase [Alistipes sp.]